MIHAQNSEDGSLAGKTDTPLVSVCVPSYNGAAHLEACLASLVRQEDVTLEVVLRDDGSRDSSLEIARDFARRHAASHPHVHWNIAPNPSPSGMVANWNACLRAASGEFVKVMGQDDLLYPQCLALQVRALRDFPEASLCICALDIHSARGRKLLTKRRKWTEGPHTGSSVIADCIRRAYNPLGEPVAGLARRKPMLAGGGYDESFKYWVDVEMWFQLIAGSSCVVLRQPLGGFRLHRGAASFQLQGDSYAEFQRIAARFAGNNPSPRRSALQRLRALLDSCARLALYRIFG